MYGQISKWMRGANCAVGVQCHLTYIQYQLRPCISAYEKRVSI